MSNGNIFYYDMSLVNTDVIPILAQINDRRQSSILDTPKEWEMSIVRFDLSSELIPLFFPVIPNPAFPLRSNKSITLSYSNTYYREFINVTPDEVKHGVFDYTIYLNHVNDAFALAFTALKDAFPGSSGTEAPRLYLNASNSLISLYTQDDYLVTNPNRIKIAVNQPLQQLLDISCVNKFVYPDPNGFEFEYSIDDSANIIPPIPRSGYPYGISALAGTWIQTPQEFRSLDEWSMIKSICFSSQLLPIVKEYIPNMVSQDQNSNINSSSKPIVTDFLVAKDSVEPTRHTYAYLPTAEYRMLSLMGIQAFSAIDITAQYQTYDGVFHDVYIAPGDSMTMKIMFRRIHKL